MGKECESIGRQLPDGREERKTIYQLSDAEVENLARIGSASGPGVGFCIYLGFRHSEHFFERVCGYTVSTGGLAAMMDDAQEKAGLNKPKSINVTFYEFLPRQNELTNTVEGGNV